MRAGIGVCSEANPDPQSDIFFPGTGGAAGPDAVHLLQSVRQLGLRVETNVGGHGGVAPFAELEKAAAAAGSN